MPWRARTTPELRSGNRVHRRNFPLTRGFTLQTPDLHRMPTTHPRRLIVTAALGLLALLAPVTPASARTAKPAGPALTIESKACNTGDDIATRSIVLTASAVLRGAGDEVQMRFTVQQRAAVKTSWRTVFAKTGDLGTWATSDAGADGLRYTKTINGLTEGTQYRVIVDARGIATGGKVVTKTTRKSYTCIQPQLTARLVMARVVQPRTPDTGPVLRATIRNLGRDASAAPVVTVRDAATNAVIGQVTSDPVPGRTTATIAVALSQCPGAVTISVQQTGDALTALAPEQTLNFDCKSAATAARRSR